MDSTPTSFIVESLTQAIVSHQLQPGAKLVEQKLADQFGVSRTLVRQALYQLAQNRLIRMEPARGAFVAAPSVDEARQVFAVRRMLEAGLVRSFIQHATPQAVATLAAHMLAEEAALAGADTAQRSHLLGDFHVRMAQLIHNPVLAELLADLVSRCALIVRLYQTDAGAAHSHAEHRDIVAALQARDEARALHLMDQHLQHMEHTLTFTEDALA